MSQYLILVYIIINFQESVCQMLGPCNFIFKKSEPCPNAPAGIEVTVSGRRLDRTKFGFTIDFDSPFDFDDNLGIEILGSHKKGTEYKPGAFYYQDKNACKAMEKLVGEEVFNDVMKAGQMDGCPIKAGHHTILDYVIDNDKFNVNHVYAEYLMEYRLIREGKNISCTLVEFELVPKNKLNMGA